uniref:Uncharacterized protein n=1 Tax=Rhizophora mucronata TaxID=61149 RepID=A0A2P2IJA9_RHIMU
MFTLHGILHSYRSAVLGLVSLSGLIYPFFVIFISSNYSLIIPFVEA